MYPRSFFAGRMFVLRYFPVGADAVADAPGTVVAGDVAAYSVVAGDVQ